MLTLILNELELFLKSKLLFIKKVLKSTLDKSFSPQVNKTSRESFHQDQCQINIKWTLALYNTDSWKHRSFSPSLKVKANFIDLSQWKKKVKSISKKILLCAENSIKIAQDVTWVHPKSSQLIRLLFSFHFVITQC